jgi:hypothetical protein
MAFSKRNVKRRSQRCSRRHGGSIKRLKEKLKGMYAKVKSLKIFRKKSPKQTKVPYHELSEEERNKRRIEEGMAALEALQKQVEKEREEQKQRDLEAQYTPKTMHPNYRFGLELEHQRVNRERLGKNMPNRRAKKTKWFWQ